MQMMAVSRVIDLTPRFVRTGRSRALERMHTVLALWTQYASAAVLALYGLLRLALCPGVPLGEYSGPLALLWPISFLLLLTSQVSDSLLWQEEWDWPEV